MHSITLKLSSILTDDQVYALGEALNGVAISHSAIKKEKPKFWEICWICEDEPNAMEITNRIMIQSRVIGLEGDLDISPHHWDIEPVPNKDWLTECYKSFTPFSVGPFFIYGSHYEGDVPAEQIGMQIDAATAFGSGEHGTTKGCLQAMLDLKGQGVCPWNVLDMGCGSGILSIAAWKLWQTPILGIDIDDEAVRVSNHHAELNDIETRKGNKGNHKVEFARGKNKSAIKIQKKMPFEMIIANILAEPLRSLAQDFYALDRKSVV